MIAPAAPWEAAATTLVRNLLLPASDVALDIRVNNFDYETKSPVSLREGSWWLTLRQNFENFHNCE
jgi:hypothetical protein